MNNEYLFSVYEMCYLWCRNRPGNSKTQEIFNLHFLLVGSLLNQGIQQIFGLGIAAIEYIIST